MGSMADNEQHRNDPPPHDTRPAYHRRNNDGVRGKQITVVVDVVDNLRLPRVVEHLLSA